jgi:hypothetical protein
MLGYGACKPKHSYDERPTYYAMNNTNNGTPFLPFFCGILDIEPNIALVPHFDA